MPHTRCLCDAFLRRFWGNRLPRLAFSLALHELQTASILQWDRVFPSFFCVRLRDQSLDSSRVGESFAIGHQDFGMVGI